MENLTTQFNEYRSMEKMSLYHGFKFIEEIPKMIREALVPGIKLFEVVDPLKSQEISESIVDDYKIDKVKKVLLNEKNVGENELLLNVVQGNITLEERLEELSQVNNGMKKKLFPRKKNVEHNERVDELSELLGYELNHIKCKGLFAVDNFLSLGVLAGLAMYVSSEMVGKWLGYDGPHAEFWSGFTYGSTFLMSVLFSTMGIINRTYSIDHTNRVRYLDSEIKRLI